MTKKNSQRGGCNPLNPSPGSASDSDKRFRFDKMAIEITKWFTTINLGYNYQTTG